jgi:hypothetical protein
MNSISAAFAVFLLIRLAAEARVMSSPASVTEYH